MLSWGMPNLVISPKYTKPCVRTHKLLCLWSKSFCQHTPLLHMQMHVLLGSLQAHWLENAILEYNFRLVIHLYSMSLHRHFILFTIFGLMSWLSTWEAQILLQLLVPSYLCKAYLETPSLLLQFALASACSSSWPCTRAAPWTPASLHMLPWYIVAPNQEVICQVSQHRLEPVVLSFHG